jgi:hypothetical protein
VLCGEQHAFYVEGFAVILDFQADGPLNCLNAYGYIAGVGMLFNIRQGRLGYPIKYGSLIAVELLNLRQSRELNTDCRPFRKFFNELLNSGY